MRIDTSGWFDVSLSHRRRLAFGIGVLFLITAIRDLIYARSWMMESRLHWLANFLVETFGNYGVVGFEFFLAVVSVCQGLIFTFKLNRGES
jgi:hypothetical protein